MTTYAVATLTVRMTTRDDLDRLQRFLVATYPPSHPLLNAKYFDFWFRRRTESPTVLIALWGEAIVGIQGLIERSVSWRGREYPAAWYCNTYVVERLRGRGIGLRMLAHSLECYQNLLTLGYTDEAGGLLRHLGFRFFGGGGFTRYWRLLDDERFASFPFAVPSGLDVTARPVTARRPLRRLVEPERHLEEQWRAQAPRLGLTTARTQAELVTRFFNHPAYDYHVVVPVENEACAILRFEPPDRPFAARIVDLWGASGRVADLLEAVCGYASDRGACFVDYYSTSPPFQAELVAAGFARLTDDRAWHVPQLFNPPEARTHYNERLAARLTGIPGGGPENLADAYFVKADGDRDR